MDKTKTAFIIDDEINAIESLKLHLSNYDEIFIHKTYTNPIEAIEGIIKHRPEVLFLDIHMPLASGFEVLKEVIGEGYQPIIIFTTAFEQYAIEAIRHSVFDYLLKPIDPDEMQACIARMNHSDNGDQIQDKLNSLIQKLQEPQKIKFNTSTGFILININDILYCQSSRNYCEIYLTNHSREVVTSSMKEVGELLPVEKFFRISRFNLINLDYLKKVERRNK